MAAMTVRLPEHPYTELEDRVLWFDGDSCYRSSDIESGIGRSSQHLFVEKITPAIKKYNALVSKEQRITVKEHFNEEKLDLTWNIPEEYKNINVVEYLIQKLEQEETRNSWNKDGQQYHPAFVKRVARVQTEYNLYKKLNLIDALRALIFIINTLNQNRVVWGVGRGSSVSSYILYLIGVHDVDSVEYELDIEDFLHE